MGGQRPYDYFLDALETPLAHPPFSAVSFLKEWCKEELFTPSHGCVLYGCLFSVGQVETENDQVRFFLRLVSLGFALEYASLL